MKSKIQKDKIIRKFYNIEVKLLIKKASITSNNLKLVKQKFFFSKIKNRCLYTNRGQAIINPFKASRIQLKYIAIRKKFPFFRKVLSEKLNEYIFSSCGEMVNTAGSKPASFFELLVQVQPRVFNLRIFLC